MSTLVSKTFNNVDNHVIGLYRYVSDLFDVYNVNNRYSDVQLKIGSKTFYCHKFVLALSSKYFANLSFLSKTGTLQSINPDQFYDVLQFMYTGEVLVSTNNIESLLIAAYILRIDAIYNACTQFLDDVLNTDNALLYWQLAKKYQLTTFSEKCQTLVMKSFNTSDTYVRNISKLCTDTIKVILSDDNLEVKSEVFVCEMLMKWLQVRSEAGHEVHPDQLLPLIRWSGISIDYVKSTLLQNTILRSDKISGRFLSKVIAYLQSGVQFEGLQTFHRPSTGLENCLVTVGLSDGNITSSEACRISLQHPERVTALTPIKTAMSCATSACLLNDNLYVTGADDIPPKEMWTWNISSGWSKCADMLTDRGLHCTAVVDSMLYVLGGREGTDDTPLSSVECYNTKTNKWSSAGQLIHAVQCAACVTYKNSIYVFGGQDKDGEPVAHVQVYNPAQESCTLMDIPMPCEHSHMRAVLWETSVILMGCDTSFIYNFETQTWQEREQFKIGLGYFSLTLDNLTVYISGGVTSERDKDNKVIWTRTDEIQSVSVLDIIQDKPAVWKHHAKLTQPSLIGSFINISLPLHVKGST